MPDATNIDTELERRLQAVAERTNAEATPDLMAILMELLAGMLAGCFTPTPEKLARMMRQPSALTRASLRQRARKIAFQNNQPRSLGDDASAVLLATAAESSEADLVAFIRHGRETIVPEYEQI